MYPMSAVRPRENHVTFQPLFPHVQSGDRGCCECNDDDVALCTVLTNSRGSMVTAASTVCFSPINTAELDEQTERTLEDGVQLPSLHDRGN